MRLALVILVTTTLSLYATGGYSQNARISLDLKNASIKEVLSNIEKASEFYFIYNNELINVDRKVDISASNQKIGDILTQIFGRDEVEVSIIDRKIILAPIYMKAQQTKVTGIVKDGSTGEVIVGANVTIEGTTQGTVTDLNGKFSLDLNVKNPVLVFSFLGYLTDRITYTGQSNLEVSLTLDIKSLEEVVLVGYGVQKKKLTTGANAQVKGDELFKQNTTETLSALQGQASGVQIVKNSGQPGADFKINIRGLGTNGDASPLYVVDGIPTSSMSFLSPSDIEAIDVLKDAASAAIYGARAANGVILVTTKQGKAGKTSVTLDSYYGWQNLYKKLDLLNAQEYAMISNESWVEAGNNSLYDPTNPDGFAQKVPNWDKIQNGTWKGTDWLEEIRVKNAPIQNYSLNITGGTEKSIYSIGVSYSQQKGILGKPVESNYERITIRVNSDHTLLKKNNLNIIKIGENMNFSMAKNNSLPTGMIYYNFLTNFIHMNPFLPVYDEQGNYHYAIPWSTADDQVNPVGKMDYAFGQNSQKNQKLLGNFYAEIQPLKKLVWRNSIGIDNGLTRYRSFVPKFNLSPAKDGQNLYSKVAQSMSSSMGWIYESTLSYDFIIKERHNINFLAGTSLQKKGLGESLSGQNGYSTFNDLGHSYLSNTPVIDPAFTFLKGDPEIENNIASFFGRLNYNFKETYLFTAVMRADGSSNFAKNNRWGYFPSFSAGWIMSNEKFMQKMTGWLDYFKLRASWGQNGNQNIGAFAYTSNILFNGVGASYFYSPDKSVRTLGAYPSKVANPDIKWETSEQVDIGFDARFFRSKMTFNFDLYRKTTKDWLVDAPVLDSYGTGAPTINGGDVRNQGVEVAVSWNDNIGEFSYGFNGNISYNENEVTRIANKEGFIKSNSTGIGELQRATVGKPFGIFWGRKTDGIFQNEAEIQSYKNENGGLIQPTARPGDFRYVDVNHDGVINENDRTDIGKASPDYTFGFTANAGYKGFDFSVTSKGSLGNSNAMMYRNNTTEILNRWHGEGTSNSVPRVAQDASNSYFSDYFVRNASYLRVSNISLGYDLKKRFSRLPVSQFRLYCAVQNLYTFTKYTGMDPEVGFGNDASSEGYSPSWTSGIDLGFYPSPRTFIIGANIKF